MSIGLSVTPIPGYVQAFLCPPLPSIRIPRSNTPSPAPLLSHPRAKDGRSSPGIPREEDLFLSSPWSWPWQGRGGDRGTRRGQHRLERLPRAPGARALRVEAELLLQHADLRRPPLRREESDGAQGEPSPPAKQHKKAKKRKSLGVPPPLATATVVPTPAETLGLERKAQRLRPLYQYINYSNPELNQAGDGEAEIEVELGLVPDQTTPGGPEEAGVERPQASPLIAQAIPSVLAPFAEEGVEEPVPILSFTPSSQLKAEVDKSTQVDIDKMLSVCAAHLVPPLSPQYK